MDYSDKRVKTYRGFGKVVGCLPGIAIQGAPKTDDITHVSVRLDNKGKKILISVDKITVV